MISNLYSKEGEHSSKLRLRHLGKNQHIRLINAYVVQLMSN